MKNEHKFLLSSNLIGLIHLVIIATVVIATVAIDTVRVAVLGSFGAVPGTVRIIAGGIARV